MNMRKSIELKKGNEAKQTENEKSMKKKIWKWENMKMKQTYEKCEHIWECGNDEHENKNYENDDEKEEILEGIENFIMKKFLSIKLC